MISRVLTCSGRMPSPIMRAGMRAQPCKKLQRSQRPRRRNAARIAKDRREKVIVHDLERRGMDRVAAKVAQKIRVLLEHAHWNAGAREKQGKHHAGGSATRNAAARRYACGSRSIDVVGHVPARMESLGRLIEGFRWYSQANGSLLRISKPHETGERLRHISLTLGRLRPPRYALPGGRGMQSPCIHRSTRASATTLPSPPGRGAGGEGNNALALSGRREGMREGVA
jgi:hypothetical protein